MPLSSVVTTVTVNKCDSCRATTTADHNKNMVKFGSRRAMASNNSKLNKAPCTITVHICHLLVAVIALYLCFYYAFSRGFFSVGVGVVVDPTTTITHHNQHNHASYFDPDQTHPFNQGGVATTATHLIVVAGHSVTISGHLEDADRDEADWYLLDYQKGHGLPAAIVAHIRAGIKAAAQDPHALLVFSGGETRGVAGPETEGASYFRVADAMGLWRQKWGDPAAAVVVADAETASTSSSGSTTTRARTVTEDFARDSFENL